VYWSCNLDMILIGDQKEKGFLVSHGTVSRGGNFWPQAGDI
jgi:hypothetical protein